MTGRSAQVVHQARFQVWWSFCHPCLPQHYGACAWLIINRSSYSGLSLDNLKPFIKQHFPFEVTIGYFDLVPGLQDWARLWRLKLQADAYVAGILLLWYFLLCVCVVFFVIAFPRKAAHLKFSSRAWLVPTGCSLKRFNLAIKMIIRLTVFSQMFVLHFMHFRCQFYQVALVVRELFLEASSVLSDQCISSSHMCCTEGWSVCERSALFFHHTLLSRWGQPLWRRASLLIHFMSHGHLWADWIASPRLRLVCRTSVSVSQSVVVYFVFTSTVSYSQSLSLICMTVSHEHLISNFSQSQYVLLNMFWCGGNLECPAVDWKCSWSVVLTTWLDALVKSIAAARLGAQPFFYMLHFKHFWILLGFVCQGSLPFFTMLHSFNNVTQWLWRHFRYLCGPGLSVMSTPSDPSRFHYWINVSKNVMIASRACTDDAY